MNEKIPRKENNSNSKTCSYDCNEKFEYEAMLLIAQLIEDYDDIGAMPRQIKWVFDNGTLVTSLSE